MVCYDKAFVWWVFPFSRLQCGDDDDGDDDDDDDDDDEVWTLNDDASKDEDGTTINVSSSSATLEWFKTSAEQDFDVHFSGTSKTKLILR